MSNLPEPVDPWTASHWQKSLDYWLEQIAQTEKEKPFDWENIVADLQDRAFVSRRQLKAFLREEAQRPLWGFGEWCQAEHLAREQLLRELETADLSDEEVAMAVEIKERRIEFYRQGANAMKDREKLNDLFEGMQF